MNKKIYAIAPLVALAVFAGVYSRHAREYEARLAETKRIEDEAKTEKLRQHRATQAQALAEATAASERRQLERAEKTRIEDAQKQARADAEQRRSHAFEQERRLRTRLERLRVDVASAADAVKRSEERKRELQQEDEFLVDYVQQAETNRSTFYQLVEKMEAAERHRIAVLPPAQPAAR